LIKKNTSGKVT